MSTLQLYNTLSRSKEAFTPREPGKVGLYVCGPTVYDYFHVGNARTFTTFDMVARWLRASGYAVTYVRNITDVDDKIMDRARAKGEDIEALTARMIAALDEDCARLGLARPDREPRATRHIEGMLEIIALLEKKGLAYRAGNHDVCYSVRDFPGYGKLSRRNLDDLRAGERVAVESAKRDPLDFVLWKTAKPGEPSWPSVFGAGRPGWHIECSAMSQKELGIPFDLHGGGWDLQFPHHENEIAQSEGAFDKPFVRYWMHGGFLNIDHEKMSKSLGNFFTARDVLDKLHPHQGGEQLRFFLLHGHYRSELSYSWEGLEAALSALRTMYIALKENPPEDVSIDWTHPLASQFRDAMNDDFDTPKAFAVLYQLRAEVNKNNSRPLAGLLKSLAGTIGFLQDDPMHFLSIGGVKVGGSARVSFTVRHPDGRDLDVDALVAERLKARQVGDYALGDQIRKTLEEVDVFLEDKPGGVTEWRRK